MNAIQKIDLMASKTEFMPRRLVRKLSPAVVGGGAVAICMMLSACGNKGDLYLDEFALSEEQQRLLDELDDENEKKKKAASTATPE